MLRQLAPMLPTKCSVAALHAAVVKLLPGAVGEAAANAMQAVGGSNKKIKLLWPQPLSAAAALPELVKHVRVLLQSVVRSSL